MGEAFCRILPAVHSISDCDTVSSFFGIGKKKVLKTLQDHGTEVYEDLVSDGGQFSDVFIGAAEKLVIHCYGTKSSNMSSTLAQLRAWLVKFKDSSLAKLPPSKPSFVQHAMRASWQIQVWLSAHIAKPNIPSPVGHEWQWSSRGCLEPTLFEGETASEIMQDLLCSCPSSRTTCMEDCMCFQNSLACTELCPCHAGERCGNTRNIDRDINDVDRI